ncbi:uncharacterized protein I303_103025 [Kwoniella dejecticola CBS 10117]|uniref:UNC-45/Cro1/She4 central domain-containing protein n=1 Tax=Kwoniella dejecticola CBS 10117 TaxID=1296121 RepID=A0A1A6AAD5_9TREE|nr:uncharacterized protein I303_03045 [Kwoniella dejecticola CBS 10117]OBR87023.1 hypothetical protein I303_03045 [Kwoniella dejecticola CBS 10117]
MESKSDDEELTRLLKTLATPSITLPTLSTEEISLLARSLVPSASRQARSLAYLCLSKFCESATHFSSSTPESITSHIYTTFEGFIKSIFVPDEDAATEPESCVPLTYLLSALFPLTPDAAVKLLTNPIEDVGDPLGISLEVAELPSPLQPALAELMISAAGTKAGRNMVRSRAMEWLRGAMDYQEDKQELGVLCAVALSKTSREEDIPNTAQGQGQNGVPESGGLTNSDIGMSDEQLCVRLMKHVESFSASSNNKESNTALLSSIEGLAVLSLKPKNKVILTSSLTFLQSLVRLAPSIKPKGGSLPVTPRGSMDLQSVSDPIDTGLSYGLTTILVNLTNPKVVLSAEDQQIAKLRAMALSANKSRLADSEQENEDERIESDPEVAKRTKLVIKAGVVGALSGLGNTESKLVKEGLGRLCRNLVEDKNDRLPFVRDGGFKVLSNIVRDLLKLSSSSASQSQGGKTIQEVDVLPSFQALAKMIITTPPNLLFPPPHLTTSLNSLTPLYHLLTHPSATSLQKFESLMALTNLASIDQAISNKIVEASVKPLVPQSDTWKGRGAGSDKEDSIRIIVKIEECLLDDNDLIRRAATQLICNLISSEKGFDYFSGEGSNKDGKESGRTKSRLDILLILAGMDDLQTRLAAGGALAIISESNKACQWILSKSTSSTPAGPEESKNPWNRVLRLLQPEEEENYDEDGEIIPVISSKPALPNPELVLRGVIILLNLINYTVKSSGDTRDVGLQDIKTAKVEAHLMAILKTKGMSEDILVPTVEALKALKQAST